MLEKIINIISEQLSIEASALSAKTSLTDDLEADSLDAVEVLMRIEEETGVIVPDEKAVDMKTIGDLASYVEMYS